MFEMNRREVITAFGGGHCRWVWEPERKVSVLNIGGTLAQ